MYNRIFLHKIISNTPSIQSMQKKQQPGETKIIQKKTLIKKKLPFEKGIPKQIIKTKLVPKQPIDISVQKQIIKTKIIPKQPIGISVPIKKLPSECKIPTKTCCIAVANLRIQGFTDLEDWLNHDNNIYVGRRGRIFITDKDKTKRIFHYKESEFANPFKVSDEMPVEICLEKYKIYLETSGLINKIEELRGKTLGCFCKVNAPCHAKVLAEILNNKCD